MTQLAFVDTETTGLDPERHEIWEVALILPDADPIDRETVWQLPVDLGRADPMSLAIGKWYERRWPPAADPAVLTYEEADVERMRSAVRGYGPGEVDWRFVVPETRMDEWAARFAALTDGRHLVGAVVSFDEKRLERLLRRHHACPTWHYHIIDVEALAAGYLAGEAAQIAVTENAMRARPRLDAAQPPWKSEDLSRAVGVDPDRFDRHTALGDARWAKAIYEAVMSE